RDRSASTDPDEGTGYQRANGKTRARAPRKIAGREAANREGGRRDTRRHPRKRNARARVDGLAILIARFVVAAVDQRGLREDAAPREGLAFSPFDLARARARTPHSGCADEVAEAGARDDRDRRAH